MKVGDVVTVELSIVAPKGQRYMCIEDARPSCLEPIASRQSVNDRADGLQIGNTWVTKKERDTAMNFFVEELKGIGQLTIKYDCVVVAGGKFTAMPARVFDMYDESHNGHSKADVFTVK